MNANIELQDRFLKLFFDGPLGEDFYLTGGTALARFYFQHRESLDLDLFTNNQDQDFALVNQIVLEILHSLKCRINSQVTTTTYIQYVTIDPSGTALKIDLVKDVPVHFGDLTSRDGIKLDSLENIGSNKLLAIFGRNDAKDFIDLYWILQNSDFKFDDLYRQALEKDTGLSDLYLAYALQAIEKINLFPRMIKPLPWDEIIAFYQRLARQLIERIRPE